MINIIFCKLFAAIIHLLYKILLRIVLNLFFIQFLLYLYSLLLPLNTLYSLLLRFNSFLYCMQIRNVHNLPSAPPPAVTSASSITRAQAFELAGQNSRVQHSMLIQCYFFLVLQLISYIYQPYIYIRNICLLIFYENQNFNFLRIIT